MMDASPARLFGAALIGVWLAGTVVALLAAWRRRPPLPVAVPEHGQPDAASERSGIPQPVLSADVFNLSSLPIWWVDRHLRLAGANEAYARAVGHLTPEGAVRANAELAPGTRTLAAEARATDRAVVGDERVTIDGERRLLEIIAIPLRGGEVAHLALDETRRHAAHNAAAARARDLAETLDELAVGTAWFDAEFALRDYSAPFARLFGLDPAWLDTRPDFDRVLDAARAAGRLPEERDFAFWRARRRAWFEHEAAHFEEDWMLPGGALLHVVGKARGGGLLLICEDRTEQALLVAARDRLLQVHTATLDNLREGVGVFGPDGRLKLFNRRFAEIVVASPDMLGGKFTAEQLMDHVAGLLNEPDRADDLRAMIVSATAGRTALSGRITSTLGYVVDVSAVPLPDGDALITFSAAEAA